MKPLKADHFGAKNLAILLAAVAAVAITLLLIILAVAHWRGAHLQAERPLAVDSVGVDVGISGHSAAEADTTVVQAADTDDIGFTRARRSDFLNPPAADTQARLYPALCLSLNLGQTINEGGGLDGARLVSESVNLVHTNRAPRIVDFAPDLVPDAERVEAFGKFHSGSGMLLITVESNAQTTSGQPKFASVAVAPNPFMEHVHILGEDGRLRPDMTDMDVRLPIDPVLADGYRLTVYIIQPRTLVEWFRKDIPPAN